MQQSAAAAATLSHGTAVCRYADAVKQDVLKQAVLRVAQSVIAALAEAVVKVSQWERVDAAVVPSLTILLEWWASTPAVSRSGPTCAVT